MTKFAYNNSIHSSTRYTPFFANTGYHPWWMMLEYLKVSNSPLVQDHLEQLKYIQFKLSNHFFHVEAKYKKVAGRHPLDSATEKPKLRRNVKTKYETMQHVGLQCLGPFVISDNVHDVTFCLDLPPHMHLHVLFHVSLLELWTSCSIPNRVVSPPAPVQLVEELLS